jgi:predicted Zn-dependent protease
VNVRISRFAWVGVVAAGVAADLPAQQFAQRVRDPAAPAMVVLTFRSSERNLGTQAADAVRNRLISEFPVKTLWVNPKTEINANLEASGYRPDEPLTLNDAKELGRLLRADQFMQGTARKEGEQWRVDVSMHMVANPQLAQPLQSATGNRAGDAARQIAAELVEARKQLEPFTRCNNAVRDEKWDVAAAAAREGIALYPRATIARVCLLNAMFGQKAPDADQLKLSEEILAIDSRNFRALSIAGDIYRRTNQQDKMIQAYTGLIAADPSNTGLVENVTKAIAGAGNPAIALPIIRKAVEDNPGDAALLRTQFLVELAARETKTALKTGEDLVLLDTAQADTNWFIRMSAAYQSDSQPQKAVETVAKGVAKFPSNAPLQVVYAQQLRGAGQTQQAVEALKRALAIDPNVERGQAQLAQLFMDLKQPDSAYATLEVADKGADSVLVGDLALAFAQARSREARTSGAEADYKSALAFADLSDKNAMTPEKRQLAKFLTGATQLTYGQSLLKAGAEGRRCEPIKQAQGLFTDAQINIPQGARSNPQQAGQLMQALGQLSTAADQQARAICPK